MRILNATKNTVLAKEGRVADTFFKRLKGLLGKESLRINEALVITRCKAIHMFFMRFAIDGVFVGKDNRVAGLVYGIRPFRISPFFLKASFVIEFPVGTIAASQTQL